MLKVDLINGAYSRCRISGLTVGPSPEDISLALDKLEDMAAMWEESNICTGYAFENQPDPNTPHNVKRAYQSAYKANLAMLLLADFGKQPHPSLVLEAQGTLSRLMAATAKVRQASYPSRMPRGSGNTLRHNPWQRFYRKADEPPTSCATHTMYIGEIQDFEESYSAFLDAAETVDSFTIASDQGLTVLSSSLASPIISYRVRADSFAHSNTSDYLRIKITANTSTGRVEIRFIDFILRKAEL